MKILVNTLFALDIGTRSVVGIVLEEYDDSFHIIDLISKEHKERSMIDGQIHNILSVASIIQEIKQELEQHHGKLQHVSVAAAGRSLKTAEGSITIDISERPLISTEDINRLELSAVQNAQQTLLTSDELKEDDHYYCVGYSVLHYKLNGEEIGSLIDQKGKEATVEVIATFLPRVVVESLLAALKRADLEMEALTLEPIAAINVLIPPSMRRLNIALVDIGAGTSDIAIANENTVTAYGMVPVAGDEVTETLSSHYLLDFPLAEQMKRQIASQETLTVHDILGFEQEIPAEEVIDVIRPAVKRLAISISEEIRRLNNGTSPQAVMIVGGGSLTPTLSKELSVQLELPENRVAIRSLDALTGVTLNDTIEASPALVTPIGIAIAAKRAPIHYMSITVNEQDIRLFELKEMTVGDALLAAHVTARQLYGKPGLALTVKVNGRWVTIPGEHGSSTTILLNGREASTKDRIRNQDVIELDFGMDGKDAEAAVKDLVDGPASIHFHLDGLAVTVDSEVLLNGQVASIDTMVSDRDELIVRQANTLGAAIEKVYSIQHPKVSAESFSVKWNGSNHILKHRPSKYLVDGIEITHQYIIQDGDIIETRSPEPLSIKEIADELEIILEARADVMFNTEPVSIKKQRTAVFINGQLADHAYQVQPEDQVEFKSVSDAPIIFSDIFSFTDFSLPTNSASAYLLLRNGESIRFNEPIFGGDRLEIQFE
ncbi:cell division protein FtsA [Sporosarcina newyorkensis]|uniref:Cell division protein FtsA n=1 Tax=Sporosarcina newyorkensis TaxID=759851 RepID=A0A1T4XRN1_9BACL|nr:cell division protein FtsA [Sporosarcina newyorkensis]SKA92207.1 cell division protein FtsA [Sporosarcina newyorkensis]